MTERKTKYTIAVISGQSTFFYNGKFIAALPLPEEEFADSKDFFCFYDEKDDCEYWIRWDKVIWIKEVRRC